MEADWDSKLVVGYKRQVAKVAKKDSDVNGKCPHNFLMLDPSSSFLFPAVSVPLNVASKEIRMMEWSFRLDVPERWFQLTRRFPAEQIRLIKVRSHALWTFAPI
jgi:hypothetical protein